MKGQIFGIISFIGAILIGGLAMFIWIDKYSGYISAEGLFVIFIFICSISTILYVLWTNFDRKLSNLEEIDLENQILEKQIEQRNLRKQLALINRSEFNKSISVKTDDLIYTEDPSLAFLKSNEDPISDTILGEVTSVETINSETGTIDKINEKKLVVFDKKDPKYLSIKVTNIILFIILWIVEIIYAGYAGLVFNPIPVYITFLIARSVIRNVYVKKAFFRNNKIYFKVGGSILIWLIVFFVKALIVVTFLNFVL